MSDMHSPSHLRSSSSTPSLTGIRRARQSYSCESCRRRRVKCDQVHPRCGNCTRSSCPCVYPSPIVKRKSPTPQRHRSPRQRTAHIESSHRPHPRDGYLSLQSGGRSRFIENTFWASVDVDGFDLDSLLYDLPLFPLESICCYTDEHLDGSIPASACRHCIGTAEPNFSFWFSRGRPFMDSDAHSLASILMELPSKEVCDELYLNFLCCVHPLIPLFHVPTFDQMYTRFWAWYQIWNQEDIPEGVLAETPSFLPLMLAIFFTSSVTGPTLRLDSSPISLHDPSLQKNLYALTSQSLPMVGFPHNPAMYSLEAFLLLHSVLIREEESLSSCSFVAVAFRIAQAMGLHRDAAEFGVDPTQAEERRRVWGYLMHLDVITSTMSGLPLIGSADICTTSPISQMKDAFSSSGQHDDLDESYFYPGYILATGRYEATSCIRAVLQRRVSHQSYDPAELEICKEMIKQMSQRIEERVEQLNSLRPDSAWQVEGLGISSLEGHTTRLESTADNFESFRVWATHLLRLGPDIAYCLLYLPLMQDRSLWSDLRTEAIPHFQSFTRTFLQMCNASAFRDFQWLYPGSYQPLRQVSVLLMDLFRDPTSSEANESRTTLERTFALLAPGPDGRIAVSGAESGKFPAQRRASKGARLAWLRLDNLRAKVWRKMGLDSSVVWTTSMSASPYGGSPRRDGDTVGEMKVGDYSATVSVPVDCGSGAGIQIDEGLICGIAASTDDVGVGGMSDMDLTGSFAEPMSQSLFGMYDFPDLVTFPAQLPTEGSMVFSSIATQASCVNMPSWDWAFSPVTAM